MALTKAHVESLIAELLADDSRLSAPTVVRIYATINAALNHAVLCGEIAVNPAALVEMPRIDHQRPEPWTPGELAQFLTKCVGDRDYPLFALMALRGLRRGEALGLSWTDIDLDAKVVRVRR